MSASKLLPRNGSLRATIRRPASDDELQQLFELRAQVYFGEGVLNRDAQPILTDSLDRSPNAVNLIAVTPEDRIVGGGRVVFPKDGWVPANTPYFDFRPLLPDGGATASCGSLLWVDRDHRRSRLGAIIARSVMVLSAIGGMSHFCVAAHPTLRDFLVSEGWEVVADEFLHPVERVPVVPLIVGLADVGLDFELISGGQSEIRIDPSAMVPLDMGTTPGA